MKLTKYSHEGLLFDNGTRIFDFHNQDCCESVYADWDQLKDTDVLSHDFPERITVDGVDGSGIKIDGYFIPCYNNQNGYYGSDLEVTIMYPNGDKVVKDISDYKENNID